MKIIDCVVYISLGAVMCLVLLVNSAHMTQTELELLCSKFNEDITLPDSQQCIEGITKSREAFTFINRQENIVTYEYIRMDPHKRVEPKTRVWYDFISFRSSKGCSHPTTFDKWRMVIWYTAEEDICFNPDR